MPSALGVVIVILEVNLNKLKLVCSRCVGWSTRPLTQLSSPAATTSGRDSGTGGTDVAQDALKPPFSSEM